MSEIITVKVDVTKIEKARLYKGTKGTYLDLVLIPTPNSEYGDYMATQSVSKEERDKGVKGPILGNGKIFHSRKPAATKPAAKAETDQPPMDGGDSDVPF